MSVDVDLVRVFISSLSLFKVSMRMVIALSMGMDGHKLLVFCLDLSIKFCLMLPLVLAYKWCWTYSLMLIN